jgi:hypothetical protein
VFACCKILFFASVRHTGEKEESFLFGWYLLTELGVSLNGENAWLHHSAHRGAHHPIMHLHERSLSVLACRYVDEVIIGAPWEVTKDMITTFNISLVVHGTCAEVNDLKNVSTPVCSP